MEKLVNEFSVGLFFWQTVIFLVLLFLLRKYAWKPILNAVNEREKSIADALNSADEAKKEMEALTASNEQLLNEARAQRDEMLNEARGIKDKMISDAKATANQEADKILAAAKEDIQNEKLAAITELKNQVAVLSIEIAEKILKDELSSEEKQKTIIDNMVKDINLN